MKKITVIQLMCVFTLAASGLSRAMPPCGMNMRLAQAEGAKEGVDTAQKAVDVENKVCPVGGEKIVEKMKATYEYEGKVYNFCCAMCIDEFKKDPQKYIKKVEEEKAKDTENSGHPQEEGQHHMHH